MCMQLIVFNDNVWEDTMQVCGLAVNVLTAGALRLLAPDFAIRTSCVNVVTKPPQTLTCYYYFLLVCK